jgi:hypothetical protein
MKRIDSENFKIKAEKIDDDNNWDLYEFELMGGYYSGHVPKGEDIFNVEFVEPNDNPEEKESMRYLEQHLTHLKIPFNKIDVNGDSDLIYIKIFLEHFDLKD